MRRGKIDSKGSRMKRGNVNLEENRMRRADQGPTRTKVGTPIKTLLTVLIASMLALCALCASGCSSGKSDAAKELKAGSTTYFFAESMDPASDWNSW